MTVSSNSNYTQDRIFDKFMELYDLETLQELFNELLPDSGLRSLINFKNKDQGSKDDLCKDLLELIGDNFLRILPDGNKINLNYLRYSLIYYACEKYNIEHEDVINEFNNTHTYQAETLEELCGQTTFRNSIDIVSVSADGVLKVSPFYNWSDEQLDVYLKENNLPNEFKYYDPTKVLESRECGLHA